VANDSRITRAAADILVLATSESGAARLTRDAADILLQETSEAGAARLTRDAADILLQETSEAGAARLTRDAADIILQEASEAGVARLTRDAADILLQAASESGAARVSRVAATILLQDTGTSGGGGDPPTPPIPLERLCRHYLDPMTGQSVIVGTGTPNPALEVPIGTTYHRRDGLDDEAVYVRTTTGWQALATIVTGTGGAVPSGAALGDLGDTYPAPSVVGIRGRPLASDVPSSGMWLTWDGTSWKPIMPSSSGSFSVSGDLTGSIPNPTVAQIQASPVSASAPTLGQRFRWSGTTWTPANVEMTLGPFEFGDGMSTISTTEYEHLLWIDLGTIVLTGWTLSADVTGSVELKIETATFSAYPTFTDCMTSERPTLTSARKAELTLATSITLTGKTAIRVTVNSASTVKAVVLSLHGIRS
jgi:hypothetical protein